ncbi:MAG TPA: hypothetical protein VF779_01195 [Pyrinomonadaceae bacterium]
MPEKPPCPKCQDELSCAAMATGEDGEIETGSLRCREFAQEFLITNGIPRFVEADNYATSLSAGGVVELQRLANPGVNIIGRKGA